jgi:hypothetical protein|uniref:Uncharacterized protein n=1 Tax=Siphoviridae sp. ctbbV81 TaxID=2827900 RepID=A0A8S5TQK1_9CAUD|nr:MAG TPA: hypothetical protein [Siphoviridae sp. ctbbV81]
MPTVIYPPVEETLLRWSKIVGAFVGKGNYSMEKSQTIATDKKKYARLFLMGNPTQSSSLDGSECATVLSFQTESYASGVKALSTAYEIDSKSHQAMVSMGFRRTYGPEEVANSEKSFKRIISRYSRIYTGQLLEA